jgi:hypothetical protein
MNSSVSTHIATVVVCCIVLTLCDISPAADVELKEEIRSILLETVHIGDPSKAQRLTSFAEGMKISLQDVDSVLIEFASLPQDSLEKDNLSHFLCRLSISVLGAHRSTESLPVLRRIACGRDEVLRRTAIRSLVRIGGPDLLDFSAEVVSDTSNFSSVDRFALYEELLSYWERAQHEQDSVKAELISAFFRSASVRDTASDNRALLDEILSKLKGKSQKSGEEQDDR